MNILSKQALVSEPIYIAGWVDPVDADQEFSRLWNTLDWERRDDAPRREYWQNDYNLPYTYGRGAGLRTYDARPWDEFVKAQLLRLNERFGFELDCCFMNGYEDKRDQLGWHADLGTSMEQPVISLSLGGERDIEIRDNETLERERFRLGHGSVFIMPAGFQQTHQHRIPKAGYEVPPRISLTYRSLDVPRRDRLFALGWDATPTHLYDEEAVEGWLWEGPGGRSYTVMGGHDEPPEVPDELEG